MWERVGGFGFIIMEDASRNCIYRCFSSGTLALCHSLLNRKNNSCKDYDFNLESDRFLVQELLGQACLCLDGSRRSPMTWQVLDWEFLIIMRLWDYAMSMAMPVIDKERTEKKNRRQREQPDRAGWITEKRKEVLQRGIKKDFKINLSCLVCLVCVWLTLEWHLVLGW